MYRITNINFRLKKCLIHIKGFLPLYIPYYVINGQLNVFQMVVVTGDNFAAIIHYKAFFGRN